ncbi:MAG: hypothetical protein ACXABL_04525 [Candidatus Thorarchaeota archaeon]
MPLYESSGIIRDLILALEAGLVFYAFLFGLSLLIVWINSPIRKLLEIRLAWSIFMFGMSLNSFFFILSDFYFHIEPLNTILVKTGYVSMQLALVGFFIAIEQILPYKTRNGFTYAGSFLTVLTVVAPRSFMELLALSSAIVALLGVALFFQYSREITTGSAKRSINWIIIGFMIGFLGFLGRSDFGYYNLGIEVYIFSVGLLIIGMMIFGLAIVGSPALDELDWKSQLRELFVIHKSGLLVYHKVFSKTVKVDQALAAAGIAGVQALFQEITSSESGFKELTMGDKNLFCAHGEDFISVILVRKLYRVIYDKLVDFTENFQFLFGRSLRSYVGSLNEFSAADDIVETTFDWAPESF